MSEKTLRNLFVFVTLASLLALGAMSVDSLSQVVSARTPQVTDQVSQGKQTWQAKNCNDCHTILGIGGYFAPDLTKSADRRGADWLRAYLTDPLAVDTKATMPNQHLTQAEVGNLVAFLQWVSRVDTNNWPPQPLIAGGGGAAPGPSGVLLFEQKGCSGCHMVGGKGAAGPGPDLTHIGSQTFGGLPSTPEYLAKYLADPRAMNPKATMPAISMTPTERDALVQYMVGLK